MLESLGTNIEMALGQEFLTWLWYNSETKNGTFYTVKDKAPYVLYVHQRIVVRGGEGDAIETASVFGVNSALREAKMGLITGKLVVRALIQMEKDGMPFACTLKAEDFTLNSFKTPPISKEDKEDENEDASFLEKMYLLEEGLNLIDDVYHQFLLVRLDTKAWAEEAKLIGEWINSEV